LTSTMQDALFYLFAALTLGSAILVVANPFSRNPVTSAVFLILTLVSLAGLFVLLHAFFLAAIQILIYAGAVMVLFLFVIMMLDLQEERRRKIGRYTLATGLVAVGAITILLLASIHGAAPGAGLPAPTLEGKVEPLGRMLFTDYLLPFEALSVLLLVAMIGVVLLGKKELR
jgi:NADH-quinone oxidoreductase subunit J